MGNHDVVDKKDGIIEIDYCIFQNYIYFAYCDYKYLMMIPVILNDNLKKKKNGLDCLDNPVVAWAVEYINCISAEG